MTTQAWPEDLQVSDTFKAFVQEVRLYLRDYEDLNRIITGQEHSTEMIIKAVMLMLDEFAGTPPPIGYFTLESLINDYYWKHGCLLGTVAHLLRSLMLLVNRNTLSFNDGGISVALEEARFAALQALEAQIRSEWRQNLHQKKIQMNMSLASGSNGLPSEYMSINSYLYGSGRLMY